MLSWWDSLILSSLEADASSRKIGIQPLPDMFFGNSAVRLRISEVEIRLEASHALEFCKYILEDSDGSPYIFVTSAQKEAAMRKDMMKACKVRQSAAWANSRDHLGFKQVEAMHDWTFTSSYWGRMSGETVTTTSIGLDCIDDFFPMEMIRECTRPVRFFKELDFWEDELADNGFSRMGVKLRVMDAFIFILMKFELRVDGVLDSRSVETRIFHEIDSGNLLREFRWVENSLEIRQFRVNQIVDITG